MAVPNPQTFTDNDHVRPRWRATLPDWEIRRVTPMSRDPVSEVRRAAQAAAAAIAPALERRLIEVHGKSWLSSVNQRRRRNGYSAGYRLADHRFCLSVFAYDPATDEWAGETTRRMARHLHGLAKDAAHDEPLTRAHAARARHLAKALCAWKPRTAIADGKE
jgi:hypothetical protein